MDREQIRDVIVENIGPAVGYADANRVADVLLAAHQADMAGAWSEGHAHGSAYADDPISFQDNPYAENGGDGA